MIQRCLCRTERFADRAQTAPSGSRTVTATAIGTALDPSSAPLQDRTSPAHEATGGGSAAAQRCVAPTLYGRPASRGGSCGSGGGTGQAAHTWSGQLERAGGSVAGGSPVMSPAQQVAALRSPHLRAYLDPPPAAPPPMWRQPESGAGAASVAVSAPATERDSESASTALTRCSTRKHTSACCSGMEADTSLHGSPASLGPPRAPSAIGAAVHAAQAAQASTAAHALGPKHRRKRKEVQAMNSRSEHAPSRGRGGAHRTPPRDAAPVNWAVWCWGRGRQAGWLLEHADAPLCAWAEGDVAPESEVIWAAPQLDIPPSYATQLVDHSGSWGASAAVAVRDAVDAAHPSELASASVARLDTTALPSPLDPADEDAGSPRDAQPCAQVEAGWPQQCSVLKVPAPESLAECSTQEGVAQADATATETPQPSAQPSLPTANQPLESSFSESQRAVSDEAQHREADPAGMPQGCAHVLPEPMAGASAAGKPEASSPATRLAAGSAAATRFGDQSVDAAAAASSTHFRSQHAAAKSPATPRRHRPAAAKLGMAPTLLMAEHAASPERERADRAPLVVRPTAAFAPREACARLGRTDFSTERASPVLQARRQQTTAGSALGQSGAAAAVVAGSASQQGPEIAIAWRSLNSTSTPRSDPNQATTDMSPSSCAVLRPARADRPAADEARGQDSSSAGSSPLELRETSSATCSRSGSPTRWQLPRTEGGGRCSLAAAADTL